MVVHPDGGRADMGNWYLSDGAQTSAHEFGHMLGLYDEYWGGGLDTSKLAADGQPITDYRYLMGADPNTLPSGGGMKQAYYVPFMNWLDSLDEDPAQRYRLVPEPGTLYLLAAALLGLVIPRSIKISVQRGHLCRGPAAAPCSRAFRGGLKSRRDTGRHSGESMFRTGAEVI